MIRLNKFITDAGYCSRRDADVYISQGRVTVNGTDATLGTVVELSDAVEIDGERVGRKPKNNIYIALNKPVGITCTTDRADKTNVIDFVNYKERIFPVGRLDKDSSGLIILTNNGDIVNKILRAGNNNPKEYIVTVDKPVSNDFVKQMIEGVRILGVKTKKCDVIMRSSTTFTIFLTQGLNRQIRRMCAALGFTVVSLKRVRVINITLGALEVGKWRYFTQEEIDGMTAILEASSGTEEASKERRSTPRRRPTAPTRAKSFDGGGEAKDKPYTGPKGKAAKPTQSKPKEKAKEKSGDAPYAKEWSGGRSAGGYSKKPAGTYNDFRRRSKSRPK